MKKLAIIGMVLAASFTHCSTLEDSAHAFPKALSPLDSLLLYDRPTKEMKVIERIDEDATAYEFKDSNSGRTLIIVKGSKGAEISFK